MGFSGEIAEGYGAGTVKSQILEKVEILDAKPDKITFVSDPDEAGGQNRGARHGIYHKMGKRSADKLGYRHAPELTGEGGVVQHYVRKKKK